MPEDRAKTLRPFFGKRERELISYDMAYRGERAWIHLTTYLGKHGKDRFTFFLGMHTYKPTEHEREKRSRKFYDLLDTLGQVTGETPLRVTASFSFPKAKFKPVVVFPDAIGLARPLEADIPVRITGLRLSFEAGPVESLIVDVYSKDAILISTTLAMTTTIGRELPEQCWRQATEVASKLVVSAS